MIITLFIVLILSSAACALDVYPSEVVDEMINTLEETLDQKTAELDETIATIEEDNIEDRKKLNNDIKNILSNISESYEDVIAELQARIDSLENTNYPALTISSRTSYSQEDKIIGLYAFTNNDAECRYSKEPGSYTSMEDDFLTTGGNKHQTMVDAEKGMNVFFISCRDYNNQTAENAIFFEYQPRQNTQLNMQGENTIDNVSSITEGNKAITGRFVANLGSSSFWKGMLIILLIVLLGILAYYKIFRQPPEGDNKIKFDIEN